MGDQKEKKETNSYFCFIILAKNKKKRESGRKRITHSLGYIFINFKLVQGDFCCIILGKKENYIRSFPY